MASERKEQVRVVKDGGYERRQRVVEVAPSTQDVLVARISKLLWLLAAIVTALLAFRFGLKLIAANPANGFVNFMYSITDVLVAPFNGIVNTPAYTGGTIIDIAALIAMLVYILAAWALVALIRILFTSTQRRRRVTTVERDTDI